MYMRVCVYVHVSVNMCRWMNDFWVCVCVYVCVQEIQVLH